MRRMTRPCFAVVALLFCCTSYPATPQTPSSEALSKEIHQISAQEQDLQREVRALKKELQQAKKRNNAHRHVVLPEPKHHKKPAPRTYAQRIKASATRDATQHLPGRRRFNYPLPFTIVTTPEGERYLGKPPYGFFSAMRFKKGITVTTSPLLGLKSVYSAADLLYQYPSMNEDLILLQQKQSFEFFLRQVDDTLANRAIIVISGGLEGQMITNRDFNGQARGDINLSTSQLDVLAMMSRWANGFFSLDYDDSAPSTGSRVENSRIYLSRGFLTIGNLNVIPVYFTIGQMYLPFGKYSSAMLTTPLTKSLARILARAAVLGYYKKGFYAEIYGFKGARVSGVMNAFREGGANMGYQTLDLSDFNIDIGLGWVSNIADSEGIQRNGLRENIRNVLVGTTVVTAPTQFAGFGRTAGANGLQHRVPAMDMHMEFSYKEFTFIGEYINSMRRFAPEDLTFNPLLLGPPFPRPGAKIGVIHLEVDYTISTRDKPIVFALTYGRTWQALALNLPEYSWAFVISAVIWKNTMFGIEYRRDMDYAFNTTASGGLVGTTVTTPPAASALPVPNGTGKQRNMVTIQFGAYF